MVLAAAQPESRREPGDNADTRGLVSDSSIVICDGVDDDRDGGGDHDRRQVGEGDTSPKPDVLGMPPNPLLGELAFIVRIQKEPVIVPDDDEDEVARPDRNLGLPAPRHPHGEVRMKDEYREHEHEGVIARDWPVAKEFVVPPVRSVPGGHFVCPAKFALAFDFDTGENRGDNTDEQGFKNDLHQDFSGVLGESTTLHYNIMLIKCQSLLLNEKGIKVATSFYTESAPMDEQRYYDLFEQAGVWYRDTHVVLDAGAHSDRYFNKSVLFLRPALTRKVCLGLVTPFLHSEIEIVVGPELGGVYLSQYAAEHLTDINNRDVLAMTAEKVGDPEKNFHFTRGLGHLLEGRRVLITEDVLTSGDSVRRVMKAVEKNGGIVVGITAICNRGGVVAEQYGDNISLCSLMNVNPPTWKATPDDPCPLCRDGVPINTTVGKGAKFLKELAASQNG